MSQKSADFLESGDNTRFSESPSAAAANDAHSRFHDLVYRMPTSVERTGSSQVQAIPNAIPGDSGVQMLPNAVPGDVQAQNLVYYPQANGSDGYAYSGGGYRSDAGGKGLLPNGATDCGWNNIYKNGGIVPGQGAFDNTQTSIPTGGVNAQFDANGNLIPASANAGAFDTRGNFIPGGNGQSDNPMAGLPTTGPGGVVDGGTFIPSVQPNPGDGSGGFVPGIQQTQGDGTGSAMTPPIGNGAITSGGQQMPSDGSQQVKISQQDFQTMLQSWAAVNGADLSNQNSYTQLGKSMADGQSTAIGPFQLDAKAIQGWMSALQGQNGQLDTNAVSQLVQSGEISQQTAQVLTSPDFAQFVQGLAQGQQPTPDQVAKLFPPELQNAIASDTLQASALSMQQQGGFDPGMVVLGAELGRQLTSQDMTNPQIQQVVNAIDQVWSKNQVAPAPQPGADQSAGVPQQPGQPAAGADTAGTDWMPPDVAPNTSSVPSGATAPDTSGGDYSQYTDNSGGN